MSTPTSYQITQAQLSAFCPSLPQATVASLVTAANAAMVRYQIDQSPRRVRYFMAQTCFETEYYTSFSEDLLYTTAERLVEVWPSRFTMNQANTNLAYAPNYINNPQGLANLVYANRDGNGSVASGDGWTFHGRGAIQLTGRAEYTKYDNEVYGDGHIIANPYLVANLTDAMLSAAWYWNDNNLNAEADADAFTKATDIINGSTASVPQRLPVLNLANSTFTW